jgi:hypothetical protein
LSSALCTRILRIASTAESLGWVFDIMENPGIRTEPRPRNLRKTDFERIIEEFFDGDEEGDVFIVVGALYRYCALPPRPNLLAGCST